MLINIIDKTRTGILRCELLETQKPNIIAVIIFVKYTSYWYVEEKYENSTHSKSLVFYTEIAEVYFAVNFRGQPIIILKRYFLCTS